MKLTLGIPIVVLLFITGIAQQGAPPSPLATLVETERLFARTCLEKGVRASFGEFFADDGVSFTPHPVNTKEDFRKRPAPPGPQTFTLKWEPVFADISRAGDLGYTTGPVVNSDNSNKRPVRYAYYFSVWKKQSDDKWKVMVDYGIGTPPPLDGESREFHAATSLGWKRGGRANSTVTGEVLLNLEREFSQAANAAGVGSAYARYLMDESRLHRDNFAPIVGRKAIMDFIEKEHWEKMSLVPIGAGVSKSADLGYTYGSYQLESPGRTEKGYVVRVWKRDQRGQWRIVADVANALGPDEK